MSAIHELRLLVDKIQKPHRKEANLFYNKYKFKQFLADNDIRVPETYFFFTDPQDDIKQIRELESFCMKPNKASSGVDVYVLHKIGPDQYREIDGRIHPFEFIQGKCRQIIRNNRSGGVLIEGVIESAPEAVNFVSKGLSGLIDYRFYFLRNKPLYVKMRVPNATSGNYSNTCRGSTAIFVNQDGIVSKDNTFKNTGTVYGDMELEGKKIPFWDELVGTAVDVSKLFELAFHSVDIVLAKDGTPCVLESEAIPWLSMYTDLGAIDLIDRLRSDLSNASQESPVER